MNVRSTFASLLILIIATVVATTQPSSAIAPEHGPSAVGSGAFSFLRDSGTEGWQFSFEAFANKNGHARGHALFQKFFHQTGFEFEVKINCLKVFTSNDAIISGTVLRSDDPEFPKHADVIFGAVDGSPSSLFDIITRPFSFPGVDCENGGFPLTFFQIPPDSITIQP